MVAKPSPEDQEFLEGVQQEYREQQLAEVNEAVDIPYGLMFDLFNTFLRVNGRVMAGGTMGLIKQSMTDAHKAMKFYGEHYGDSIPEA
jgi:hypothetical protein